MNKDFLTLTDINSDELYNILETSAKLKAERGLGSYKPLANKSVGMIFAKSSTRTRISFEVGINELGGNSLYMDQSKMQVQRGESIADTARVLSRYLHGVVIRTYSHEEVEELAKHASIPIINALTNDFHPCQVLADLFTIYERNKDLDKVKLVYIGDGDNNMANSLIMGAKLAGMQLVLAAPEEYRPRQDIMDMADSADISWEKDPVKAIEGADYIYTDVWVSMGFEEEKDERLKMLAPYQVNMKLLEKAKKDVKVLHCLPAHRGEEITDEVMDSDYAVVFDEAENRLHAQKALMSFLIGDK